MIKEEMDKLISSITEKVGEEKAGLIADDIGLIITDNDTQNNIIESRNSEIEKLKVDKENLIKTNGNLLQQIAVGNENELFEKPKEPEKPKYIEYKSLFDEKGNFIE